MPVTELLNLENLRQFSTGMNVLLPFSIARADTSQPINDGDDWEVRIVKPRGGGMLIKTAGLDFPDDTVAEISVPVEPLDFDRNGTYYYQVIKTTGASEVKSDVKEFVVKPSLPTGLPISPPVSPFQYGIPFFNAAGESKVSPAFLRYEDTANNEFFYVRGRKAANAFKFEFDGWNGAAYTTGLYIKSTHASGYFPKHLYMENTAYDSRFYIGVGSRALQFFSDHIDCEFLFGGYYGNYIPLKLGAGATTTASPRVKMTSFTVNDVIAEFRGYAGQAANIWEYRKSDNTLAAYLDNNGYGSFGRVFTEYIRNLGTDAGVIKLGRSTGGDSISSKPYHVPQITSNTELALSANRSLYLFLTSDGGSAYRINALGFSTAPLDGETHYIVVTDDGGNPMTIRADSASTPAEGFFTNVAGDALELPVGTTTKIVYDGTLERWRTFRSMPPA